MSRNLTELAPVPRSQATNAYDLLEDVCKAILEEPRRYNQGEWLKRYYLGQVNTGLYNLPDCGTVACVAGWTAVLAQGRSAAAVEWQAQQILGLNPDQCEELFSGGAVQELWMHETNRSIYMMPRPGTAEYAEFGVRHIRAFMAKYEAQLKAKLVGVTDADRA